MNSTGLIGKILEKIKAAKTPDRFSQDYLGTVLGFASGSAKPFIPLAKRLTLINSDGTPTALYSRFRGSAEESKSAMAAAIKVAYAPLYKRNEYADQLDKKKLEGLVKEVAGLEDNSSTLRAIVGTFEALKTYADFGLAPAALDDHAPEPQEVMREEAGRAGIDPPALGVRFGYTININLPNTNDIAVFNAIFKSMKEHLL